MLSKKTIIIIGAILALLAGSFFLGRVSTKKERSQLLENLAASRDSVKHLVVEIDGKKIEIAEKDALVLSQKEAIKAHIIEKEWLRALHIKELTANAELKGQLKQARDSIDLVPGTEIITVKDTSGLSKSYVKIPFKLLDEKNKYLTLEAGMKENKKAYYNLEIPFEGTMTIGYKKDGFLKKKPVGIFKSENPYLIINDMSVLIIEEKKTVFQKDWFQFGVGVLAGAIGYNLLTK